MGCDECMALRFRQLSGRRRCHAYLIRFAVTLVFSLWFVSILYGAYYSQHDHDSQDLNWNEFRRQQIEKEKSSNNDNDNNVDGSHAGRRSEFVGHARNNQNGGHEESKFPYHNENNDNDNDIQGSDQLLGSQGGVKFSRKGMSHSRQGPKEYTEYDWRSSSARAADRATIGPGGRRDNPRLGERGRPVNINPATLNRQERVRYQQGWDQFKFNDFASQKISVQRDVPDFRPKECSKKYGEMSNEQSLPKASIIICFFNEAWTVLLRSIHSILLRSPPHLIGEIILVDDFSDHDDLKGPLERFVSETDKLRLLRMTNRSGLVRARLAGVDAAVGPILIFLDSHVECAEGWLEPLLSTVAQHPNVAVTPQIDVISDRTFAINNANPNIGVLEFKSFNFDWGTILPRIQQTIQSRADAFQSPTMAGGLFAIRKDFFLYLGTYDPLLALWGGENIELSLKLWLCGGGILTHPCSRVAHVFRDTSPYLTGSLAHVAVINSARVAYVWTGEYKKFYFKAKTFSDDEWQAIRKDIQERIDLRIDLDCKPFGWFLEHVYPELHIEGSGQFIGPIMFSDRRCILEDQHGMKGSLVLADCQGANLWEYSRIKEIRSQKQCLTVEEDEILSLSDCNHEGTNQQFEFNIQNHWIYHPYTERCLSVGLDSNSVVMGPCQGSSPHQVWYWRLNKDYIP